VNKDERERERGQEHWRTYKEKRVEVALIGCALEVLQGFTQILGDQTTTEKPTAEKLTAVKSMRSTDVREERLHLRNR
jgi:hypothetical protein